MEATRAWREKGVAPAAAAPPAVTARGLCSAAPVAADEEDGAKVCTSEVYVQTHTANGFVFSLWTSTLTRVCVSRVVRLLLLSC